MTDIETPDVAQETGVDWLNAAIESVMDMVDEMALFDPIQRGALGTASGITCEIAPGTPETGFLGRGAYFAVTLTFNAKHANQYTLLSNMNKIFDSITRRMDYSAGEGWEIVDIENGTLPRKIGREENNEWIAAGDLVVKIYRKDIES